MRDDKIKNYRLDNTAMHVTMLAVVHIGRDALDAVQLRCVCVYGTGYR